MPPDVMSSKCPSRRYMAIIASKWSLLIINALEHGAVRNGQLMRRIDGISQKMLTQTLRELEAFGLVSRYDAQSIPPHVTYQLTPLGMSLRDQVRAFIVWVERNLPDLKTLAPITLISPDY